RLQSVNPLDRPLIAMSRPEQEAVFVRVAEAVEAALSSPAATLWEKIRRRFQEIEAANPVRQGARSGFMDRFIDSMSHDLELTSKNTFLMEELVALGNDSESAPLREILTREISAHREQLKRLRESRKAAEAADMERLRKIISGRPPA
ncbi:MAG TPA: hypothetical protein VEW48_00590, partial [Thermoanaerobaculia bacterium]|nr:hypothetical protein [Thermoanaerobaculia bacterium]